MEEAEDRQRQAKMVRKMARMRIVKVPMTPNRRRHVVSHFGEALRAILDEYKEVRVTVPPPEDTKAQSISVVDPKDQMSAVTAAISRRGSGSQAEGS